MNIYSKKYTLLCIITLILMPFFCSTMNNRPENTLPLKKRKNPQSTVSSQPKRRKTQPTVSSQPKRKNPQPIQVSNQPSEPHKYREHNDPSAQIYKCLDCNKVFAQRNDLTRHMRIHTNEKPFKCTHCTRNFRYKYQCEFHKYREHNDPSAQIYKCLYCNKVFAQRNNLTRHMRTHNHLFHTIPYGSPYGLFGQRPDTTNFFTRNSYVNYGLFGQRPDTTNFFTRNSYVRPTQPQQPIPVISNQPSEFHKYREHNDPSAQIYKCLYCNKVFAQRNDLTRHMRTHNPFGAIPYGSPYGLSPHITELNDSIAYSDIQIAKKLIDQCPNLDQKDNITNITPVQQAILFDNPKILLYLIQKGASYNSNEVLEYCNNKNGIPYQNIINHLNNQTTIINLDNRPAPPPTDTNIIRIQLPLAVLKKLQQPQPTSHRLSSAEQQYNARNKRALKRTCRDRKQIQNTQAQNAQAQIDACNNYMPQLQELFHKAMHKNNIALVKLLLEKKITGEPAINLNNQKAKINYKGSLTHESTPLYNAIMNKQTNIIRLLLEHKADPNGKNYIHFTDNKIAESTPLYLAVQKNNQAIIQLLLKHGANIFSRCKRRIPRRQNLQTCTPYQLAMEIGNQEITTLFERAYVDKIFYALEKNYKEERIEELITKCPNINQPGTNGITLIKEAMDSGISDMVLLLLKKGAKYNQDEMESYCIGTMDDRVAKHLGGNILDNSSDESSESLEITKDTKNKSIKTKNRRSLSRSHERFGIPRRRPTGWPQDPSSIHHQ